MTATHASKNTVASEIFPGEIKPGAFETQIKKNGVRSSFRGGNIYRHAGIVPLLDIRGDNLEMGLQYGVLMRPEILKSLDAFGRMIRWAAESMNVGVEEYLKQLRSFALGMMAKVPDRFYNEARGISQGSGVPLDSILMVTCAYDFIMTGGCTSVLMRAENGRVIHARNNDTSSFGGAELGRITAVVRRQPVGLHTTVQLDYPLILGIESGFNNQGLAFTEETLSVRQPNPDNFSVNILARMILEECSSLEELPAYFDRYPVIAGYGEVWSSQCEGRGWLVEQTHAGWAKKELEGDILWDFNTIYSADLRKYEKIEKGLRNDDDREAVARCFPRKEHYTVQDGINFIRASDDGTNDHIHFGTRQGICNAGTQQAMVFDPEGQGVYLAWGEQYCSRANFYYIHEDFSIPPDLAAPQIPLSEKMIKMCEASFMLVQSAEKMAAYLGLAQEYPGEAHFQFQVVHQAFLLQKKELFIQYAEKAYQLQPNNAEYRLYAGIAAFWSGDEEESLRRLECFGANELFPKEELYRLTVLEQISHERQDYSTELQVLLDRENASEVYCQQIVPLIRAKDR